MVNARLCCPVQWGPACKIYKLLPLIHVIPTESNAACQDDNQFVVKLVAIRMAKPYESGSLLHHYP